MGVGAHSRAATEAFLPSLGELLPGRSSFVLLVEGRTAGEIPPKTDRVEQQWCRSFLSLAVPGAGLYKGPSLQLARSGCCDCYRWRYGTGGLTDDLGDRDRGGLSAGLGLVYRVVAGGGGIFATVSASGRLSAAAERGAAGAGGATARRVSPIDPGVRP